MNLKDLKDILFEVQMIMPNTNDLNEINSFKEKVVETFRTLFPNQSITALQIQNLRFEPWLVDTFDPDVKEYNWKPFFESKERLIAIIKAKVDSLEKIENNSVETLAKELKVLKASEQDLLKKNKQLSGRNDKQSTLIEESINELNLANSKIRALTSDISRIETDLKRSKNFASLVKWTALAASFALGAGAVGIKVDFDKRKLQDTVDEHKITIDSLRRVNRSIK